MVRVGESESEEEEQQQQQQQVGQAIYTFAKSRSRKKWPTVVASLMLSSREKKTRLK